MAHTPPSRAGSLPLIGSEIAFDFTNTASGRGSDNHREHLRCGADVVAWARHARVLTPSDGEAAARLGERDPAPAARLLERALALRETIHRTGVAIWSGGEPSSEDRDAL